MGYTTDFFGSVTVEPPLNDAEISFLKAFNESRRMERENGAYFVNGSGYHGQSRDEDVTDYNNAGDQPGLWCQWRPTDDGAEIEWDGGEKFYDSSDWMTYIIDHFLKPGALASINVAASAEQDARIAAFTFDHVVNGTIDAQGEDPGDIWRLVVTDNVVKVQEGVVVYRD